MSQSLGAIFEFLFKYRPWVFERGRVALASPWPPWLFVVAGAGLGLMVWITYRRVRGKTAPRDRALLAALRAAMLLIVLFALARPVLVVSTVVPQRNYLGILLDDSRSMQIADVNGLSRGSMVREAFGPEASGLVDQLSDRFLLRYFRFAETAERVHNAADLTFSGGQTNLGRALDRARQELSAVPLSGLVVLTDGADNAAASVTEPLLALKAAGIPVYPVGLGQRTFARDLEIHRIETPRAVLRGTSLMVDVLVVQQGYEGRTVQLQVEDEGQIVSTQDVALGRSGEATSVRVHFTAGETGPRRFRFRIPPQDGEQVTQNNEREALIVVHDRREKILYLEGEPRFEVKFIRRAVAEDENLQVVVLQRTAENKFLRLDVDGPDELVGGFPKTREELYAYQAIILGSMEASFFTHDQLRMIAEFVSQRGGGLLMLGGRRAFTEGGYADTPVADALPIVLEPELMDPSQAFMAEIRVELTPSGETHPATQVAADPARSAARWRELPPLTTTNRIRRVKPGATRLVVGRADGLDEPHVVLAHHRYGRGKALAFAVQDSWLWQMHADMALDDMTHETLWRQLLRWLVSAVPGQVRVTTERDWVRPGETVAIVAEVEDDTYLRVNNIEVTATITSPSGVETTLPLEWTVQKDGEYHARAMPQEPGLHQIRVTAQSPDRFLTSDPYYVQAADLPVEFFDAAMRSSLLERLADETGGRFYTPATVGSLPEDIAFTQSGMTVLERRDLWDMPILFLLLLACAAAEWGYRRRRGLV